MTHNVMIIGGGPVGLTLSLLLAQHGVSVALIEKRQTPGAQLRAVSLDDECLRIWQACGLEELLDEDWGGGASGSVMCRYQNAHGRTFLKLTQHESDLGYPHAVVIHQARIESKLQRTVDQTPSIELFTGYQVTAIDQDNSGVTVRGKNDNGDSFSLRGSWTVACDGGSSMIRSLLGIDMHGVTLKNPWLVANLLDDQVQDHALIRCDPCQPSITIPLPHSMRRIECMLDADDDGSWLDDENVVRNRLCLAWAKAAEAPIIERSICHFNARIAERWRCGRVFLAGDAAHTTPPFAGQGLATGLRDASNLAFKLAGVCRGWLLTDVLDTYELERRPHQERMIRLALRLGTLMMPRSRTQALCSQIAIRALTCIGPVRRHLFMRGRGIRPVSKKGFLVSGGKAGQYLPQPWVALTGGQRIRLDLLLGPRMTWVAVGIGKGSSYLPGQTVSPGDTVLVENRDFRDSQRILQRTLGAGSIALVRPDRVIHTHLSPSHARSLIKRSP